MYTKIVVVSEMKYPANNKPWLESSLVVYQDDKKVFTHYASADQFHDVNDVIPWFRDTFYDNFDELIGTLNGVHYKRHQTTGEYNVFQ